MSSAKKINAFSIFILFVFLAAILYASVFLVNTANSRKLFLNQKIAEISDKLESLTTKITLYSSEYYQGIADLIESDPTVSALIITQDSEPVFVWPTGSSFISTDADNVSKIESDSALITIKDGYFITNKGITNWSAALATITPEDIYYRCSHSFIAILTATLLCLMVIAYISIFKVQRVVPAAEEKAAPDKDADEEESLIEDDSSEYPYDVELNDDIDSVFDEQDNETIETVTSNPISADIPDDYVVEAARHQASVHAAPKKRVLKESEDPLGLFSDLTGFGWESYLEPRLDSELIRAASSEYDLALFIVKLSDVERTHPAYADICAALLSFFKFRDMVFEYGSDSFAGIVTGMDINGCMGSVENLYNSLSKIMKDNHLKGKISIGISTRCFRLIPGERLLHEAKDAVIKATEETDMPIVAFRVNPGKYKEYLEEEMGLVQEPIAS